MKKIMILLFVMAFIISGCANTKDPDIDNPGTNNPGTNPPDTNNPGTTDPSKPGDEDPNDGVGQYKDGTYSAEGDEWEYGLESASVVIDNGKMKEVTLRRLDKEGTEVDYGMFQGKEVEGRVYPNLDQYRKDLAEAMIDKQSYNVESIAGATVSSENWKLAVERALDSAK